MKNDIYDHQTYFALALDPIHVGTGGYRLGRVDMSIMREPGTNLPKIPGTSLAGACRTYAAMQAQGKFPHCAGQGQPDGNRGYQGHCGEPNCPICVTFGFTKTQKSLQGLAQFSDARLILFPVHSLAGPVWVTCPDALRDVGVDANEPGEGMVRLVQGITNDRLNLGWLMLKRESTEFSLNGVLADVPEEIRRRTALVSNRLFSHIVNDNLEVRTSVSIDPSTGAASEHALFTYEALPRASVLMFEVVVSDPKYYQIDGKRPFENDGANGDGKQRVRATVESGLCFMEALGIGGMSTRGMGRLRVLGLETQQEASS